MPGSVHDPVSRTSYEFTPDGENLTVETWMEPGGGLPAARASAPGRRSGTPSTARSSSGWARRSA